MLSVSFWSIYWYKAYYNRLYIFGVTIPKIRKTHFLKQSSVLQPRPFRDWALLHGFDFAGGGARKRFTSCFTSNLQFWHKTWNVSHRNYSCAFTTSYHVSHYPVYPEITKRTSSIYAKTEPDEGRNMASVNLHAQVQRGCVATKGTSLCFKNASDFMVFILFAILCCYGN